MGSKKKTEESAKDEEKKSKTRTERYERNLRCALSAEEVADRADRAAQLLEDRDHKEEELKAHAKHAKGEIERIEAEMRQYSNEVRTRSTYRDIECERIYEWDTGRVREVRGDTGEVISDREMTEREKQMGLFDGKDPPPGGGGNLEDEFSESASE